MNYDKIKYWNERIDKNNNFCRSITNHHIEIVNPHIEPGIKILEYGPDTGRMLELYGSQKSINFYDISSMYSSKLKDNCNLINLPIDTYTIDKSGNIKTNFDDDEFDLVCAFEVLLHSPDNEIEVLINELSRIGKEVIIVTWYEKGLTKSSNHCWTRDYKNILTSNNLKILHWDETSFNNQVFFKYKK